MAKTEEDIARELAESIQSTDNTLDTVVGPIPVVFIRPQAGRLADASSEAEQLRQLFTISFDPAITQDEIALALGNYGSTPGAGTKAKHIQYFQRFTRPLTDVQIPAGTLVANQDGSLIYRVLTSGTILASSPAVFYNASRNAYEIGLQVEAVGTGPDYNLPPFRVNTLLTSIKGIDSTENRSQSTGGLESESTSSQTTRLKNQLLGIDLGSPGGVTKKITDAYPELVTDVSVVQPFQAEFKRLTTGPALDVYIIANDQEIITQTVIGITGQTQIVLSKQPASSITSLTVNGISGTVNYQLVKDTTFETGYSTRSQDMVVLDTPLIAGDEVVIQYQYNAALNTVYDNVFATGQTNLFNTDILIRYPFVVNPVISGNIKVLPSYTTTEVENGIATFLENNLTFTIFTSVIYPEVLRQQMLNEVSGIQSLRFTEFRRNYGSLSTIEPLVFAANEISVYDSTLITFKVVG